MALTRFWAKTGEGWKDLPEADRRYHPLLYHLLDVAAVTETIWDEALARTVRQRLETALGPDARKTVIYLAAMHDLGKASPGFQGQVPELGRPLQLRFDRILSDVGHGVITTRLLCDDPFLRLSPTVLAGITGGHHGSFPRSEGLGLGATTLGDKGWRLAREALAATVRAALGIERALGADQAELIDPGAVPLLAGLISVADWIGSNQDHFPCDTMPGGEAELPASAYWTIARSHAREALEVLGWLPAVTFAPEVPFDVLFPQFPPNELQQVVARLAAQQRGPYLMIVEAPMGQGKTEAAFLATDHALSRRFARGAYVAMPTQATSNAMFERFYSGYLKDRGHQGRLNLQLVHGDALLALTGAKDGEVSDYQVHGADADAASWFSARKRPLLAPFGVGTIDQSLLSVLQTRHWFVRLFGLASKVVVFDEVHAYDTYMTTILERLLHWLSEMDCTVILLSATLPAAQRQALVEAYSGRCDLEHVPYPRVTICSQRRYPDRRAGAAPESTPVPVGTGYHLALSQVRTDLADLARTLAERLTAGGCAAVICNTVNRAIEVHDYLKGHLADTECLLFHARTLTMWRRERERQVLSKFGKEEAHKQPDGTHLNPNRPERAVLVATQVIEQSLDLDFDFMISEMAPVDLLLQRAGRMHRHHRRRKAGLEAPRLVISGDMAQSGPPPESFGRGNESVYERYILLRTWLALRDRNGLCIPGDVEKLIDDVYGEAGAAPDTEWAEALATAEADMRYRQAEAAKEATKLLVSPPEPPEEMVEAFNSRLADDEDPSCDASVRAATRQGDPSVRVVLLPGGTSLTCDPGVKEVRELLDRSVSLNHKGLFAELMQREAPKEWQRNGHLRYARLVWLDSNGVAQVAQYQLSVDEEWGVRIK